ncbi:MAG: hypothetical protein ACRD6N_11545 [Pyrinomonadaceae bacterium]
MMRLKRTSTCFYIIVIVANLAWAAPELAAQDKTNSVTREVSKPQNANQASDKEAIKAEHASIGIEPAREVAFARTTHPDAQWYPDAGLGLFIHWGISSVKGMNISWPMIPGRPLARNKVSAEERERIIREADYNLNGKPPQITPMSTGPKRRTGAASYQSYLSYRAATRSSRVAHFVTQSHLPVMLSARK